MPSTATQPDREISREGAETVDVNWFYDGGAQGVCAQRNVCKKERQRWHRKDKKELLCPGQSRGRKG